MKRPNFMQGRYGFDTLFFANTALCLLIALLGYTVLWRIPHVDAHSVIALSGLYMIINISRVFSKDIGKRENENLRFTMRMNSLFRHSKPANSFDPRSAVRPVRGAHTASVRCSCGAELPTPEGSGRQIVVCPVCGSRNLVKK